ncbi:MAG: inorganic diphosphatase, partial [Polyangiaceae bacterium]
VEPMCMMRARAIGVMQMRDDKGIDDKIIAVHVDDPAFTRYRHIDELMPHVLLELRRFFQDYKVLENKEVVVSEFEGPEAAQKIIAASIQLYVELMKNKG